MNRPHTTPSLKTIIRRVVQWSMPLSGTLLLLLFVLFKQESARALESFQNSTRDIVNLHANIIDQQLTTAESTLRYLSEQPALLRFLQDGSTSAALAGEYLRLCREYRRFNQVRVLNTQGRELLRINASQEGPQRVPEEELQNKSGRYYFREASSLSRGEVFISPFDLNVEHGTVELPWRPVIRIATPIFNPLDQVLGLLLINYGGNQLLSDLAETSVHAYPWCPKRY